MIAPMIWYLWWMMGRGFAEYPLSAKEEKQRYSKPPRKLIDDEPA